MSHRQTEPPRWADLETFEWRGVDLLWDGSRDA
jgi:hypothetical protein